MSFFDKDFYTRRIRRMLNIASKLALDYDFEPYVPATPDQPDEADRLHEALVKFLDAEDINGGEDYLFEHLDKNNLDMFAVALDFYDRLNNLTDARLEQLGFSRDEVREGLLDAAECYGVGSAVQIADGDSGR